MGLREKQSIFARNVGKLISFAYDNGYEITFGECYRTIDQQLLYYLGYYLERFGTQLKLVPTKPLSRTMNSYHRKKLAIDINLFKDGKYLTTGEAFKPLAEYWKTLHEKNESGYDWGWDFNHFQMS